MMKTDVVIVGGGPSGTASSMYLTREGIQNIIIEKQTFPRYHIGESMSSEAGDIIRDLGLEDEMNRRGYPQKKGVLVYGPNAANSSWFVPVMARQDDGTLRERYTWQVRRDEFDLMLLQEAEARGATVIKGHAVKALVDDEGAVTGVKVRMEDGSMMDIHCEVLLDCSGQATFLANQGITGPKYLGNYDRQVAIFSRVEGTLRDNPAERLMIANPDGVDRIERSNDKDNTIIFYQKKYHWAWFIPLDDNVVSVGVVSPAAYFQSKRESKEDYLRRELKELNTELARRIPDTTFVEPIHAIPNYSFQVKDFTGKGFICIGDAHRFVDPIFSFGLYVALQEARFAAKAVKGYLNGENRDAPNPFADYQLFCEKGIDVLEDMIDFFWEQPLAFALFAYQRYVVDIIDIFAGRVFDDRQPSPATKAFRAVLKRDRESYYQNGLNYSIPIGSRYHPERAPLWAPDTILETTERWMREHS